MINKIYNESCLDTMARMPDNFIDLTVTSPPYDKLRAYNGYSFDFEQIACQLYRITHTGGIIVWVVNDATIKGSESGTSFRQALYFMECGFKLHDTMIFLKNSPAYPANINSKRYGQQFEYMFIFSKGAPKTVNLLKDKLNRWAGHKSFGTQTERLKNGNLKIRGNTVVQEMGYRYNVWQYSTGAGQGTRDKFAFEHPATFPEKLAEDHIITWSNENDIVYDPFTGSGTTLKMALINNRQFIGSEISAEYCKIAEQRIEKINPYDIL